MDAWTIALFTGAAFLAVTSLVRLMRKRRDEVTAELRRQFEFEERRMRDEKKKEMKQATK